MKTLTLCLSVLLATALLGGAAAARATSEPEPWVLHFGLVCDWQTNAPSIEAEGDNPDGGFIIERFENDLGTYWLVTEHSPRQPYQVLAYAIEGILNGLWDSTHAGDILGPGGTAYLDAQLLMWRDVTPATCVESGWRPTWPLPQDPPPPPTPLFRLYAPAVAG